MSQLWSFRLVDGYFSKLLGLSNYGCCPKEINFALWDLIFLVLNGR